MCVCGSLLFQSAQRSGKFRKWHLFIQMLFLKPRKNPKTISDLISGFIKGVCVCVGGCVRVCVCVCLCLIPGVAGIPQRKWECWGLHPPSGDVTLQHKKHPYVNTCCVWRQGRLGHVERTKHTHTDAHSVSHFRNQYMLSVLWLSLTCQCVRVRVCVCVCVCVYVCVW